MSTQQIISAEEFTAAILRYARVMPVERVAQNATRDEEGNDGGGMRVTRWIDHCLEDPEQMYEESRLRVSTFLSLAEWLEDHGMGIIDGISVEEKLLIFLYICGQRETSFMHAKFRCGYDVDTIKE
jgi:hypothetical protein